MMTGRTFDVVVVGAGITGATLACALGMTSLKVALLDAHAPLAWRDGDAAVRVSAINTASQRIFEALGAWPAIAGRRISPLRQLCVWQRNPGATIHFDAAEIGAPQLGHIIENPVVVSGLQDALVRCDSVERLPADTVVALDINADAATLVTRGGQRLRSRLVVAADGAASTLRQLACIATRERPYHQKAIVATIRPKRLHQGTAFQRFLPSGPLALLPLADGACSIVWSADTLRATALLALDDAAFCAELESASQAVLGGIENCGPRAEFTLTDRAAVHYVVPRLALAGDAAHVIHPLAGLGANQGIIDAATLAEVLAAAAGQHRDPGALHVLRRYERWRRSDNRIVAGAMRVLKQAFGAPAPLARSAGLALAAGEQAGPLKRIVMRRAMGLTGDLPRLATAAPASAAAGSTAHICA